MLKSLEELADISYGKDYKSNLQGTDVPIIGTGGIMGYTSIKLNSGPAILTGRKGSINNPLFVEGDFWNVDTIFCVKAKEGVDPKWLFYNLRNKNLSLLNEATGVPSVSSGNLYRLQFKFFELPQQLKIASILSTCDEVIEKTEAAIAKYQALKQGMMHDLFTRGIDLNTGKLRLKCEDAPELYQKSELGMIPKDWEVKELNDYCQRISVGIATSSSKHVRKSGVLFLRNQNIKENYIDLSDTLFITKEFAEINKSKYLTEGDVITVRTGYPGISAVVSRSLKGAQTFTTLITSPKQNDLNSYFLSFFINSKFGKDQIFSLQGGGAQQNLNSKALEVMRMIRPNLEEQNKIVQSISILINKVISEQSALAKYQQLKAGLMEDLLMGKVEVKVEEDLKNIAE